MPAQVTFQTLPADVHVCIMKLLQLQDLTEIAATCKQLNSISRHAEVRVAVLANNIAFVFARRPTDSCAHIVEETFADVAIGKLIVVYQVQLLGYVFSSVIRKAYNWGGIVMLQQVMVEYGQTNAWRSLFRLMFAQGYNDVLQDFITQAHSENLDTTIITFMMSVGRLIPPEAIDIMRIGFRTSVVYGHVETARLVLQQKYKNVYVIVDETTALTLACFQGHTEVVALLLSSSANPMAEQSIGLRLACYQGKHEVVKSMLEDRRADPTKKNSKSLIMACYYGHLEVVKLLLRDGRVDPTACDSAALQWASENNHAAVVKLLLKDGRSNVNGNDGYALRAANRRKHSYVIALLMMEKLSKQRRLGKSEMKQLLHAQSILGLPTNKDQISKDSARQVGTNVISKSSNLFRILFGKG
eukprot:CFRG4973T1